MADKKLKIGLIGFGKMGKTIEKLALQKGHDIVLRTSSSNALELNKDHLSSLDVAIEFTSPEIAPKNLELLAKYNVPTVCGSTAWLEHYDRISDLYTQNKTPFLYASNFSIGVNVMFSINKHLAEIMNKLSSYEISMLESHHIEKKDAPSGTAVSLAEQILNRIERKTAWSNQKKSDQNNIEIHSIREHDVKGLHEVKYSSRVDEITLRHEAFSREGFASGALLAAEWIIGKDGIYNFENVLNL
jgi:4-hydroxy-tetrahydrodipicolinate reductase